MLCLDSHHDSVAIYRQTGYLPGELALDPHLTGRQILVYLGNLFRGDLGTSYRYSGGRGVAEVIGESLVWTLLLVTVSLTLAGLIGSALGIWAAWRRGRAEDLGLLTVLFTLRSIPAFWLAMILSYMFIYAWSEQILMQQSEITWVMLVATLFWLTPEKRRQMMEFVPAAAESMPASTMRTRPPGAGGAVATRHAGVEFDQPRRRRIPSQ